MAFLQELYWGNTIQNWLVTLLTFAAVFALFKIIKRVAVKKLSTLAAATDNQIDDLFVYMFRQTKSFILFILAFFIASNILYLNPTVESVWRKVVVLLLIVQGGLWADAGIDFLIDRTIRKRKEEDSSGHTTIRFLGFTGRTILWVIVLILILDNLGVNITGLVAGLGIGGIAVALAVQNILGDLLASLSIILDKPFVIGDFIEVDSLSGTVEYIGLKTTRLRSLSGEQLIFSNNDLLKSRIRNYKRMFERRVVFSLGVDYQTPLEKLKDINTIVSGIIEKTDHARFDRVNFKEYGETSLKYEVVYFVDDPDYKIYMEAQEKINLEILRCFNEKGIKFAYPARAVVVRSQINPS